MRYAVLNRDYRVNATVGKLSFYFSATEYEDGEHRLAEFSTLELPWKDNQVRVSCIPEGTYYCKPRVSPRHGKHFILEDVPGRTYILIHIANYTRELMGCIAPGMSAADIDGDGVMDVDKSRMAMDRILRLGDWNGYGFILKIKKS